MSKARVRVEMKHLSYNATYHERQQALNILLIQFRKRCKEYGILSAYKEHEYFESKPDRERRKRKEAKLRRIKEAETAKHSAEKKSLFERQ